MDEERGQAFSLLTHMMFKLLNIIELIYGRVFQFSLKNL